MVRPMSETLNAVLTNPEPGETSKVILLVKGLVVTGSVVSPAEMAPHILKQAAERGSFDSDCICLIDAIVTQGQRTINVPALVIERSAIDGGMGGSSIRHSKRSSAERSRRSAYTNCRRARTRARLRTRSQPRGRGYGPLIAR